MRLELAPDQAHLQPAQRDEARGIVVLAVAVALSRAGWTLSRSPWSTIALSRGDQAIDLQGVTSGLIDEVITPAAWQERCAALGIDHLDLGAKPATGTGDRSPHPN